MEADVAISQKTEDEWQAEEDLRSLMRAEEIKKDKNRYSKAMKMAKKKRDEMTMVMGEAAAKDNDADDGMSGNPFA